METPKENMEEIIVGVALTTAFLTIGLCYLTYVVIRETGDHVYKIIKERW